MFILNAKISVGSVDFTKVNKVEIVEDVDTLTDTCTITLPKKIKWIGKNIVEGEVPIKRGDKVNVCLGYDESIKTVFVGYVRDVQAQSPMKIICEDAMFILKTKEVQKQVVKGSLKKVVDALLQSTVDVMVPEGDTVIGKHRFTQPTIAKELDEMKKDYGLKVFCKDGKLYVCWLIPNKSKQTKSFVWGKNMIGEDLKYTRKEDIILKIKAHSLQELKDKKISVEVGDANGEIREVFAYNLTKEQLKAFAMKELDRLKQTKYEGNFTAFGEPIIHKMDVIRLQGQDGNKGSYSVKKITKTFGTDGYRQHIELGNKIS